MVERRFGLLLFLRQQRQSELETMQTVIFGGDFRALPLGMGDAAAGNHQIDITGPDTAPGCTDSRESFRIRRHILHSVFQAQSPIAADGCFQ